MSIDSTVTRRMTMANEVSQEKKFVPSTLPWVLGGGALLVFLITLNRWVSFGSLTNVAMVSGWIWQPELTRPLYWLVTLPLRVLPPSLIPLSLNLFSAVCAAATLALLARSVALLPHDRTEEQRLRERSAFSLLSIRTAWLPPLLAVLVCGLQLTFWEHATAASSEIFDLLLFAYVVRCLLEFRLYLDDSWLLRACLVYGAAMSNNWAMIALAPIFLAALVWVKGADFFDFRFLQKAAGLGALGLCFYLLLPAVQAIATGGDLGFWEALKTHLVEQKTWLGRFSSKYVLFKSDHPIWVLALPSLLPVLAISVRWPSYFGDPSKLGVALATFVFHFLYGALVLVCLWVALDPKFSPRNYAGGPPGLPLYYLGALSIGYIVGYFLLIFGGARPMLRTHPLPGYPAVLNALVTGVVWALLVLVPAGLLYRNLPQIQTTNGRMLRQYTELMARNVPASNSVVLSDDPFRLMLLKSLWTQKHESRPGFLLETKSLSYPYYQRFLVKQYQGRWNADVNRKVYYGDGELLRLLLALAATNTVCYLHPSFGYYFEAFFPEPHGLVYELKKYPADTLLPPLLSEKAIQENQAFWTQMNQGLLKQIGTAVRPSGNQRQQGAVGRLLEPLLERVHVTPLANLDALFLAHYSSRALNTLGVQLQQKQMYPEAAAHFLAAKELSTNNVAAEINLESNRVLAEKGGAAKRNLEEQLGRRSLQELMTEYGPFDEPMLCYSLGRDFFQGQNYRQAAQEFNRATQLIPEGQPENLGSRLLLARSALVLGLADEALKVINDIHSRAASLRFTETNAPDLLQLEAIAYFYKHDTNSAVKAIESTLGAYPKHIPLVHTASLLYLESGMTDSAVKLVEKAWETYPRDIYLLEIATQTYLQTGQTNSAVNLIENALSKNPTNETWLAAATKAYLDSGCYSNALNIAERQLKNRPDNLSAIYAKGVAYLRLNDFANAANAFTPLVQLGTNDYPDLYYSALMNRGYSYYKGEKLDEAQRDYEIMQQAFPNLPKFTYGLGEIAYAKKDTKAAIRNYKLFLERAPTNTPEASNALARLKELSGGR